jgi:hypothetical protein
MTSLSQPIDTNESNTLKSASDNCAPSSVIRATHWATASTLDKKTFSSKTRMPGFPILCIRLFLLSRFVFGVGFDSPASTNLVQLNDLGCIGQQNGSRSAIEFRLPSPECDSRSFHGVYSKSALLTTI